MYQQARHEQVDTEAALAALKRSAQQEVVDLDAEDEEAVRQVASFALVELNGLHCFAAKPRVVAGTTCTAVGRATR